MSKEKDTAIDLYELYKSVYEDMVASAPAGEDGGGEVASPATGQADGAADIVQDTGFSGNATTKRMDSSEKTAIISLRESAEFQEDSRKILAPSPMS